MSWELAGVLEDWSRAYGGASCCVGWVVFAARPTGRHWLVESRFGYEKTGFRSITTRVYDHSRRAVLPTQTAGAVKGGRK